MSLEQIDIYNPDVYVLGPPHEAFEYLRREQPVYWQAMPDGTGYWAVLKYADVIEVARQATLFSSQVGGIMLEDQPPEQLELTKNTLLMMDPPRHTSLRQAVSPPFRARQISGLEPRVRVICREVLARGAEMGSVEFVHDVAAAIPSQVFGELMGIPAADRAQIHRWAEMITGRQDPDLNPEGSFGDGDNQGIIGITTYGIEFAQARRGSEGDDLAPMLLATEIDGQPMSDLEFGFFFGQLVAASNDTTRTMLSSGVLTLLRHPEALDALRTDRSLIPRAVEEILRWANPFHYFRRTATADAVVGDQQIKAGDKLALIFTSANRDESVFADPHRFDIRRDPNPHLSFGAAHHFCLGAQLARLEGRVFFEELFDAYSEIELTGEPQRQRSNLNNALKALPLRLVV